MVYSCIISFPSPTTAEKAVRLLSSYGYPAKRVRLPGALSGEGCAPGVTFPYNEKETAARILGEHGISFREVFYREAERET